MDLPELHHRQIHLNEIPAFLRAVIRLLSERGVTEGESPELFASCIEAQCADCRHKLTGKHLFAFATAGPRVIKADRRFNSLHMGYCPTDGCKSYYFAFTFKPHPSVDWEAIETAPASSVAPAAAATIPTRSRTLANLDQLFTVSPKFQRQCCLAVSVMLLAWGSWRWFTGGTIPIIREAGKFTIVEQTLPSKSAPDGEPVED